MQEVKVRYAVGWGVFMLVAGIFILLTAVMLGVGLQIFMGFLFSLMGILYLSSPAVVVTTHEVELKNLFGMTMRRHPFSPEQVTFEGKRIFVGGQKIKLAYGMFRPSDLEAVQKFILQLQTEGQQPPLPESDS